MVNECSRVRRPFGTSFHDRGFFMIRGRSVGMSMMSGCELARKEHIVRRAGPAGIAVAAPLALPRRRQFLLATALTTGLFASLGLSTDRATAANECGVIAAVPGPSTI